MKHGQITVRLQGEVTDDGSRPEFIGTEHQPDGKDYGPAECSLSGKTGFKGRQNFINEIQYTP